MRATAAEIVAQRGERFLFRRLRVDREQRLGGHDHAVEAVAALRGLLVDESLLHHVRLVACAEAFERHDVAPGATADRNDAGAGGHAIDQDSAGAAFTQAATVFRAVESEVVAQHIEQRRLALCRDVVDPAVHGEADRCLRHPRSQTLRSQKFQIARNLRRDDTVCTQTCKRPCRSAAQLPALWTKQGGK